MTGAQFVFGCVLAGAIVAIVSGVFWTFMKH